jgi:hypothetical protein
MCSNPTISPGGREVEEGVRLRLDGGSRHPRRCRLGSARLADTGTAGAGGVPAGALVEWVVVVEQLA